jgi:hypothetical protein
MTPLRIDSATFRFVAQCLWFASSTAYYLYFHGSTDSFGLGLLIVEVPRSHSDTPENTQHSQETDIPIPGRIRTRNSSNPAATNPHFRPHSHRDCLFILSSYYIIHLMLMYPYDVSNTFRSTSCKFILPFSNYRHSAYTGCFRKNYP